MATPPARCASSASRAMPALSTWPTPETSKRRTPASIGSARVHASRMPAVSRSPPKRNVSASRCREMVSALGIGLQLAAAQVGGNLLDRLVGQLLVELLAECLHERHAFNHHVEHLPGAAGLAHQVIDRHRLAAGAQHLARHLDANPA